MEYNLLLDKAIDDLEINTKTIQEACIEHASLYLFYYDKYCELKSISDMVKIDIDRVRGELTKKYTETYSITLGSQIIGKYIDSESEFIKAKQLLVDVDEVKNKYEGLVEAFISRGYQLNNITKQRVAEVEKGLL